MTGHLDGKPNDLVCLLVVGPDSSCPNCCGWMRAGSGLYTGPDGKLACSPDCWAEMVMRAELVHGFHVLDGEADIFSSTPDNMGYYLLGANGGVYNFGPQVPYDGNTT